jgi:hypothetical protein
MLLAISVVRVIRREGLAAVAVSVNIVLVVGIVASAIPVFAGEVTVAGQVVDENRRPAAGVRIWCEPSAGSVSEASRVEAVSDPGGRFELTLPAGSYLLSAEGEGFFAVRQQRFEAAESTSTLEIALARVRQTSESVNVSATVPPVDVEGTTLTRRLSGRQIIEIPFQASRSFRSALSVIPGTVQDQQGNLHFDGAMENQVFYSLNGFNVGDPLTGRFTARMPLDAIQSVDYASGRYSPEFGKGSAGTLAIQTTAGDDRLRYTATNFFPGIETQTGLHIGTWGPRVSVSGPIRKGRAWFSETLDGEYSEAVVTDLPPGENRIARFRGGNVLHSQVNLNRSNILSLDFLANFESAPRSGITALDPRTASVDRGSTEWFWSAKDQVHLPRGFILEAGLAETQVRGYQRPQGTGFYVITPNGRKGNYFVSSTQWSQRDQFVTNVLFPAIHLGGVHYLKVGADIDLLTFRQNSQRTGYEYYDSAGNLLSRTTFGGNAALRLRNTEASSYIVDAWQMSPNLRVEYGLRQDRDSLVKRILLSPRVGAAWSPWGWKNTTLAAGYAVIYDASSLSLFSRPYDQYGVTTSYDPNGAVLHGPGVTLFRPAASGLTTPRYQNWTFGVDQRLPARFRLSFSLVRRRGTDGFTYANEPGGLRSSAGLSPAINSGSIDALYVLTNLRRDRYDSASATLHQSFGREYEWMLNYTRSSAQSNAVVDISVDQPLKVQDNFGPLPWDAPNRVLSWGYLPTWSSRWAFAYLLDYRTGFPFSIQRQTGEIIGPVNSQRFPANFDLNLHLERKFHFRRYRFAVRAGLNNVANAANATGINNVEDSPQFLRLYGREGRHAVFRLRWLGRD